MAFGSLLGGAFVRRILHAGCTAGALLAAIAGLADRAYAAPTPEQALKLAPIQAGIDYESPPAADASKCTLTPLAGNAGWEVKGPNGEILRRFADSNGDNKIDLWCYYKSGIEVYRDIDSNYNGKADQYRWLGTAGTRWGSDTDEDGKIDAWRLISPEETTIELVEAIKTADLARFKRLLLTADELAAAGLPADKKKEVSERIANATEKFDSYCKTQPLVTPQSVWLHFAAAPPGTLAAGTDGFTKDLTVYENVSAMVDNAGKQGQVQVGTMIQVAGGWRLFDLPAKEAAFNFMGNSRPEPNIPEAPAPGMAEQALVTKLNELDKRLDAAPPAKRPAMLAEKADLMQKIATVVTSAEVQASWIRQLADTISGGSQAGQFPQAANRLKAILTSIAGQQPKAELTAYVKFRYLTCDYNEQLQGATPDTIPKVQEAWLKELETFVTDFPESKDAAEAMLQLALAQEFAGQDEGAKKWYAQIAKNFADDPLAKKAAGAVARLESVGKVIPLQGVTLQGKPLNLASYQGKIVLIHYWANWCEPCKQDMGAIRTLLAKFEQKGFAVIGISLDNDKASANAYVAQANIKWPQLYEEGGLDSRLANELGVLTLPTMLLVDQAGRVIDRNANLGEVEKELAKRLK